ncbi:MAG: hypothetical protein ABR540_13335 [Acidimicrobiales bacterium]|nr:hypothetical protein [Actinomycetota bacterium]
MVTCCSHCGADLSGRPDGAALGHWDAGCPDCGLVADDKVPVLAPGGEEVVYSLAEWSPGDRILLRNALRERGVPWRWEPGPALVVDDRDQEWVEAVFDDLEEAEQAGDVAEDGDDDDAPAEGEASPDVLGDLFVVADRLIHAPTNGSLVTELGHLAEVVEGSGAPFGIERTTWKELGRLTRIVVDAGESADEEAVENGARTLREFLREYV